MHPPIHRFGLLYAACSCGPGDGSVGGMLGTPLMLWLPRLACFCTPRRAGRRPETALDLGGRLADLSKGGDLRVGMEDVPTMVRGVLVEQNASSWKRAADLATWRSVADEDG